MRNAIFLWIPILGWGGTVSYRVSRSFRKRRPRTPILECLEPRRLLAAEPLINEFMAINQSTLQDEDGDFPDWLELTNAGDVTINLDGYWLTDDANELTRWRIPDVTLGPAENLVLFASGKDRDDPAQPLHTDFRLAGSGEYLALVAPDGQTVVHDFSPQYPQQVPDVSYGIGVGVESQSLLGAGATATYFAPTDDTLTGQWQLSEFDDRGWSSGATGIGYDTGEVEIAPLAEKILQLEPLGYWRFEETSGTTAVNEGTRLSEWDGTYEGAPTLDLAGPTQATFGLGEDNSAAGFDGSEDAVTTGTSLLNNVSEFTMMGFIRPTGVTGSRKGAWGQRSVAEFGFGTSTRLRLNTRAAGRLDVDYPFAMDEWHHVAAVGSAAGLQIYLDGQLAGESEAATTSYGSSDEPFNIGGGGILSSSDHFNGEIDEVALFDRALTADEIADLLDHPQTQGGPYREWITTDVASELQDRSSSLYVRIPFTVADPSQFNQLTLQMKYDDGFVAYINGTEVARRNAPVDDAEDETIPLPFDATAVSNRFDTMALQSESVSLSRSRDTLLAGDNLLAIHGLNLSAENPDFLLVPELEAAQVTAQPDSVGYLTNPTPGKLNDLASEHLGPLVTNVRHAPHDPTVADSTIVTATVKRTLSDVAGVELVYRVMYQDEITVPMADDGTGGDAAANDGIYTATIPAGLGQPGEMLRWYVRASDVAGGAGRMPQFEVQTGDNQSPEYLGTMIADPSVHSEIPILHWWAEEERRAGTRAGTRASLYFDGEFYDNVFVRQRGGSTANNPKTNFKFDFRGNQFRFDPAYGRVEEFNLNSTASDKAHVRQAMAFEAYSVMGTPSSISFPMHVRRNNEFYGVFIFIEEPSEELLAREGLDPDGALYKIYNEFTSPSGAVKKTRKDEGNDDLTEFIQNVNRLQAEELTNYLYDNVDLPAVLNYLVATVLVHQNDNPHKNHFVYRDSNGSGEWLYLPWDHDLTWGSNWVGTSYSDVIYADMDVITEGPVPSHDPSVIHPSHPFVNTEAYREWNNHWNRLMDPLLNEPTIREMYLRRLRSGMDMFLGEPGTTDSYFDQRFDEYAQAMVVDAQMDTELWPWSFGDRDQTMQEAIDIIKNDYLEVRRQHLYVTHNIANVNSVARELIPEFAPATYFVPADDSLGTTWTAPDFDDSAWTAGETGIGFENTPRNFTDLIRTNVNPVDTAPDGTSVFLRIPFRAENPADFKKLTLRLKYDDAFVAYINGVEVARDANVEGDPTYNIETRSRASTRSTAFEDFDVSDHVGLLRPGDNILAIHAINRRSTDSDMLMLPVLIEGVFSSVEVAGIPDAQVGNPAITFDAASYDVSPASGNQDEEYVKLDNPNGTAVDISGWRLTGGIEHTFREGTVIPSGGSIYVSPNVRTFRARQTGPSGSQGLFVQGNYQGHLSNFGETVQLVATDGSLMDTLVTAAQPTDVQRFLRITELNYNPQGLDDATEFIELKNISAGAASTTLDLTGVVLSQGPSAPYRVPDGTTLGAGEFLVIVNDPEAFRSAYPAVDVARVLGPYQGNLSNQGERIKLDDGQGNTIAEVTYGDGDPWPQRADGAGATLVLADPANTPRDELTKYYQWRGSTEYGGSPAADSSAAVGVVVNEVLSNTDPQDANTDSIELLNTSDTPIDVSGWYLSDSVDNLLKFRIPDGTTLEPGQYVVFDESHFNPNPQSPASTDFALNGDNGDDVWLVVSDGQGAVSSFVDDVHFGAAAVGESWGRTPNGLGRLAPMTRVTLGAANREPRVGPVIISEVNYNPAPPTPAARLVAPDLTREDLEFVEIYNGTDAAVDLTHWRIRGGAEYDFPGGVQLEPGQTSVIVSFNPDSAANAKRLDALRTHYGLDTGVNVLGGYRGRLDDNGEPVRLERPGPIPPGDPTLIPGVLEDEVVYDDLAPWPSEADGMGASLTRTAVGGWGVAASSWGAAPPTPGEANVVTRIVGDSNNDGAFDERDLQQVEQSGKYLTGEPATTAEGDWNGDGVFNQLDLVAALQLGEFEPTTLAATGPRGTNADVDDFFANLGR